MDDAAIVMEAANRAGGASVGVKLARLGNLVLVSFGGKLWEITSATPLDVVDIEKNCAEIVAENDAQLLLNAELAKRDIIRQKAELQAIAADVKLDAAVRAAAAAGAAKM